MEEYIRIGTVLKPHGLKGELKVFPNTDDPQRFRDLKEIFLDDGKVRKKYTLNGVRFFKKFVLLKLDGVTSIDEAEKLRRREILIGRENAVPLKENEYYVADLIGMDIIDENGTHVAVLKDVIKTGANDVYSITMDEDAREVLIPAIKDCILSVSVQRNQMKVHFLKGLLD